MVCLRILGPAEIEPLICQIVNVYCSLDALFFGKTRCGQVVQLQNEKPYLWRFWPEISFLIFAGVVGNSCRHMGGVVILGYRCLYFPLSVWISG